MGYSGIQFLSENAVGVPHVQTTLGCTPVMAQTVFTALKPGKNGFHVLDSQGR